VTEPVHSSDLLSRLIDEAPKDTVDLDWLLGHLQNRGFGVLLLVLAIAIIIPGLGIVASIAIAFPAVEMMLARERPSLPRFITRRSFATERFTTWSAKALPILKAVERISRSRWHTPPVATKRAVGLLVLLLAISGIWPLPLINLLPAVTIAVLAIAYLQEDGLLLAVAFMTGVVSLLIFCFLVWTSADAIRGLSFETFHLPWRKS
jgi:hypothetical protein